jgi:DNA-binding response OmpR family regulator
MIGKKILIVDDEKVINNLIRSYVEKQGYTALSAFSAKEALDIVKKEEPDLIILDIMLPDMSGVDVCLEIRKTNETPILFLSCKTEEVSKIVALSVGGDDYITKPFLPGELVARIKAHLRRRNSMTNKPVDALEQIFEFSGLTVNAQTREVVVNETQVALTAKEFDVLILLINAPKRIFSAEQIFEQVWKTSATASDLRTVMVYISTIRKKIECTPNSPKYILNIRRVGYKFNHHLL